MEKQSSPILLLNFTNKYTRYKIHLALINHDQSLLFIVLTEVDKIILMRN